ncbi:hypothetical protein HanRHA438_Chr17g0807811 [Helianthus annuus]|nr:hypothetical protein HanHA300_Chr17g0650201 [Helianthus annuus]KAJ0447141.1 hypothetical protein HanHA89_Chr17g0702011 [Helianthus annuus]KAJ0798878.1 hypothetical protein HanLR1_Chr00c2543g0847171 [Helianthus annuus]KAJ0825860.1 hypothetical protein HanRHA438_Chr17g0807811 [Helianthus annuus]
MTKDVTSVTSVVLIMVVMLGLTNIIQCLRIRYSIQKWLSDQLHREGGADGHLI